MRRVLAAVLLIWLLLGPTDASAQLLRFGYPGNGSALAVLAAETSSPDFSSFAGAWARHGFGLTINGDGSANADWRLYRWCNEPGVVPPCDSIQGNLITSGGHATIAFDRVEDQTAFGQVTDTSHQNSLPKGTVTFTLREYGLGDLTTPDANSQGTDGQEITLCGPRFQDAPEWFRHTDPCGA